MAKAPVAQLRKLMRDYGALVAPLKPKRAVFKASLIHSIDKDGEWNLLGNVDFVGVKLVAPGSPPLEAEVGGGAGSDSESETLLQVDMEIEYG